jgi:transcriptional regulator with XRE-family HTH domain
MTPADLKAARTALGLSQFELADALGLGRYGWQAISRWENGRAKQGIPGPAQVAVLSLVSKRNAT